MLGRYPALRSVLTYSALYPASNLTQQLIAAKRVSSDTINVDWKQVARFFFYGGFIHSQIVTHWLAFVGKTFPKYECCNQKHDD